MTVPSVFSMLPAVALLLYVAVAPDLLRSESLGSYDTRRLLELIVLAIGCAGIAGCDVLRNALFTSIRQSSSAAKTAWCIAFVLGTLSCCLAPFPLEALLDVAILAGLVLTTLACAAWAAGNLSTFRTMACTAIAAGAVVSLTQFIVSLSAAVVAPGEFAPLFPGYLTPRFFSQWQTWTLPLIALPLVILPPSRRVLRGAAAAVVTCWWTMAFLAGGRGTLLSLLLAFVCIGFVAGARDKGWLRPHAWGSATGLVLAGLLFAVFPDALDQSSTLHRFVAGGDSGRWDLWRRAVDLAIEHPLLGAGPVHYGYYSGANVAHPHNALLTFVAEWGVPAALAIVFLVVCGLRLTVQSLRTVSADSASSTRAIRYALGVSVMAAALHANLSGVAIMPLGQMGGCLVLAWLCAEHRAQNAEKVSADQTGTQLRTETNEQPTSLPLLVTGLAIVPLALLTLLGAAAVGERFERERDLREMDGLRYRPRVWQEAQTNFTLKWPPETSGYAPHE